jgi:plastocyanin
MVFKPQVVTVNAGDRLIWFNRDLVAHTATDAGGLFDSNEIRPQESWSFIVRAPGTYAYVCAFHPTMSGKLVVE